MTTNTTQSAPKGWQRVELGSISDITNGKANTQDAVVGGEYPLFDRSVSIKSSDKYLFDRTAVILPGEGAEFIPRYYSGKFNLHQRVYAIFPSDEVYPPYLFQYLYANRAVFAQNAVGSTVKSLRLPIIKKVPIMLPPLKEQEKIAEILTAVDDEIQKIDEVIVATERLKKGFMYELFKNGVVHIKLKEVGGSPVPQAWEVSSLLDAAEFIKDGTHGTHKNFTNGIPLLSAKDIVAGQITLNNNPRRISPEDFNLIHKRYDIAVNDILLTIVGTIGRVALVRDYSTKFTVQRSVAIIRLSQKSGYLPEFYYHFFCSESFQGALKERARGLAQVGVYLGELGKISIPKPPITEQKKIVDILSTLDERKHKNEEIRSKLMSLKVGLANDLLRGKKRTI